MEVWEQQESESSAAFTRFLVFRNLGPGRTVELAHKVITDESQNKSKKIEVKITTCYTDSSKHSWRERAAAWDIDQLNRAGEKLVLDHIDFVQKLLTSGLDALKEGKIKPENVDELLAIGNFIGAYITPQTIERFRERAADWESMAKSTILPSGK